MPKLDFRIGIVLFLILTISGVSLYSYSKEETYPEQYVSAFINGQPYYSTQWITNTVHPYQYLGGALIFLGVIVGIGTGLSFLQSRNRMKEIL